MTNKLLKKLSLSLGAAAGIVAPIATVISCGPSSSNETQTNFYKLLPTYTGQADQLISLGIKPDYYPLQLDAKAPFDYLSNPTRYMNMQSDQFKQAFAAKIASLIPDAKGTSWWNQQALGAGEKGSDPVYWQHMEGDLVLYEHYLLDDGTKVIEKSTAPKHLETPETYIQTNFRASRDPYTRMPKEIIESLLDQTSYDALKAKTGDDAKKMVDFISLMLDTARAIEGEDGSLKAVDGKPLPKGIPQRDATDAESGIYNDYVFAKNWHVNFMDNTQFTNTSFDEWIMEQRTSTNKASAWVFDKNPVNDEALANLFFNATYQGTEKDLKDIAPRNYMGNLALVKHHPIYEQQEELGGAPMFEGAMRDNSLYLYDLASKVTNAFTKDLSAEGTKYLLNSFAGDSRLENLKNALSNADKINSEIRVRMANLRKVVDALSNPIFGLVTIAPGGGESTVQTSSKYSFLYKELGFSQPVPDLAKANQLNIIDDGKATDGSFKKDAFFNMDDNGWWWNISKDENGHISSERTNLFKVNNKTFDLGFVTTNSAQYDAVLKDDDKTAIANMFGDTKDALNNRKVDYNMWNEGLKTPFVIHMMLDQIMNQMESKYGSQITGQVKTDFDSAKSWGSYFTTDFIK